MNNLSVPKASLEDMYPKLIITGLNSGCWTEVILPVDPNMLNLHSQDQCNDPNDLIGGAEATAFVWTAWLRLDETKSQEAQIHGLASNTVSVNQKNDAVVVITKSNSRNSTVLKIGVVVQR